MGARNGHYEGANMEEKVDRLFLEKDCPHCGVIRAELDMNAVTRDDFRGPSGQKFFVFSALSNEASLELLAKFGLEGPMPVLVTHAGEVRRDTDHIIGWLRVNKMSSAG
jgi:hypothetical protein